MTHEQRTNAESLKLTRSERTEQRERFDALDAKASSLLGFSATVVTLIGAAALVELLAWAALLLPAAVASAHVMHAAYGVLEVVDVRSATPRGVRRSIREKGHDPVAHVLAAELELWEEADGLLARKADQLAYAQKCFATLAYLLVAGVVAIFVGRTFAWMATL